MKKEVKITIDLTTHFIVTFILAALFYGLTGKWQWAILAIIGGIFIDLDHFIDYFLYYGPTFNLIKFLGCEYYDNSGKCYIPFHSLELILLLWLLSIKISWILPLVIGMTLHLAIDYFLSHRSKPLYLFLFYRWHKGFVHNDK